MVIGGAEPGELAAIAVLIPAWQPEAVLEALISQLASSGFERIVVVDDGSSPACQPIFERICAAGHLVLRHAVNLGKGRALKSGFNHLLTNHPNLIGVVTVDADGQHSATDVARVARTLLGRTTTPVLGVRAFSGKVPLRSRFGNTLTRYIFAFITGVKVSDTQTGLRGLPLNLLPQLMRLEGERYEYEMTMLASLCRGSGRPMEVAIDTIYIDSNRSSHFDPVWDSMRIYFVLARFLLSSLIAAGVDFLGFTAAFSLTHNIAVSVAVGRLSSIVNFTLNRRFVFHNEEPVVAALWRYYVLVAVIGLLSYVLVNTGVHRLHWNVFAAKLCIDVALSLISFSVQRTFIFRRSGPA